MTWSCWRRNYRPTPSCTVAPATPDRTFTVRVTLYPGDYAWGEVIDHGGTWTADELDDEHGRGLAIVAAVAGDGNWGIDGGAASRAAWFRLDWHPNAEERDPSSA